MKTPCLQRGETRESGLLTLQRGEIRESGPLSLARGGLGRGQIP